MRCTAHRWKVKSPPGRLINARPCDATQVMSDDDMYAILPSGITAVSPSLGATPPSQFVPSLQAEVSPPPFQVISAAASAAAAPKKVIGRRRLIICAPAKHPHFANFKRFIKKLLSRWTDMISTHTLRKQKTLPNSLLEHAVDALDGKIAETIAAFVPDLADVDAATVADGVF